LIWFEKKRRNKQILWYHGEWLCWHAGEQGREVSLCKHKQSTPLLVIGPALTWPSLWWIRPHNIPWRAMGNGNRHPITLQHFHGNKCRKGYPKLVVPSWWRFLDKGSIISGNVSKLVTTNLQRPHSGVFEVFETTTITTIRPPIKVKPTTHLWWEYFLRTLISSLISSCYLQEKKNITIAGVAFQFSIINNLLGGFWHLLVFSHVHDLDGSQLTRLCVPALVYLPIGPIAHNFNQLKYSSRVLQMNTTGHGQFRTSLQHGKPNEGNESSYF